jgi:hypothetical protein
MSLDSVLNWLETCWVARAMAASVWAYPVVETLHMCAIVVVVGTSAIVDFRLIGWRLRRMTVAELAGELAPWTRAGIVGILMTGPLLFVTDPDRYVANFYFRLKMTCLLLTILFDLLVTRRMRAAGSTAGETEQRFAGGISLLLWAGVVTGGRGIGIF